VDRLFNDFAQDYPVWGTAGAGVWPPLNVWMENDDFILEAQVPGLKMDQIEITCEGRDLTIRGERQDPGDPQEGYQRRERFVGSFLRSLTLPADIDAEKTQAMLEEGILHITVPKAESTKPRRIEVKASSPKQEARKEPVNSTDRQQGTEEI
jgi:HSP20 family protein